MKNTILLLFTSMVFIFSSNIKAQSISIQIIEGKVFSKDPIKLEGLHIINLNNQNATITNENGEFQIVAKANDSISISAVNIQQKVIVISENTKASLSIEVKGKVVNLREVELSKKVLTGELDKDLSKIPLEPIASSKSIGFEDSNVVELTPNERKLIRSTDWVPSLFKLNIIPLINAIKGKTKNLKKIVSLTREAKKMELLKSMFNDSFLINLGIKESELVSFWNYCEGQLKEVRLSDIEKNEGIKIALINRISTEFIENREN